MPLVTAITPSNRSDKRAVIHVDGRAAATLPMKVIERLGVAPGCAWDDALSRRIADAVAFDKALAAGMRLVNRRAVSSKQATDKLASRGFDAELVRRVVERMRQIGAIDDEALGRQLVDEVTSHKPAGEALLRHKLADRGLDEGQIDQVINDSGAAVGGEDQAMELAREKLATMAGLDHATKLRRLAGLLARRGFDEDTARSVLERLLGDGE